MPMPASNAEPAAPFTSARRAKSAFEKHDILPVVLGPRRCACRLCFDVGDYGGAGERGKRKWLRGNAWLTTRAARCGAS